MSTGPAVSGMGREAAGVAAEPRGRSMVGRIHHLVSGCASYSSTNDKPEIRRPDTLSENQLAREAWRAPQDAPTSTGMFDSNFYDAETDDECWLSGVAPRRSDTRYSSIRPSIDEDARRLNETILDGAPAGSRGRLDVRCCRVDGWARATCRRWPFRPASLRRVSALVMLPVRGARPPIPSCSTLGNRCDLGTLRRHRRPLHARRLSRRHLQQR